MEKVRTDKGEDHASPDESRIGSRAGTEGKSADHATASDGTGGDAVSEPSASRGQSGDMVASGAVRGPSGSEQASGTNSNTARATILRNDA